jgi:hypothetical protein
MITFFGTLIGCLIGAGFALRSIKKKLEGG